MTRALPPVALVAMAAANDGPRRHVNEVSQVVTTARLENSADDGALELMIDALANAVVLIDTRGQIVTVNRAWQALLERAGISAFERSIGSSYLDRQPLALDAARTALDYALSRVLRGEVEVVEQHCACELEGVAASFVVRARRVPARDFCILIEHEDITAAEQARSALHVVEKQLSDAQQQLIHVQKLEAVGRLASGVAHDFNNMLTSIICFTRFVADDLEETDPKRQDLNEVLRAADSATRLTTQLLAFSRRRAAQPQIVDLNEALASVERILRRTLGERVQLGMLPADEPMRVSIDPGQLDQLIFNLAVNARDAMPQGGQLTFSLQCVSNAAEAGQSPSAQIELCVRDSGHGIAPEALSQVFEPFFTTKGDKGTGLGLATCKRIVEQAHGRITVASTLGEGAAFSIRLPRALEAAVQDVRRSATLTDLGLKGHVLVVEDQPAVLASMSRAFTAAGLHVLEARNAEDALNVLRENKAPIDLLVTDVVLPGMSGQDLADQLRQGQPALPVLFVSGYADEDTDPTQTRNDARTSFVSKPFTGRQLVVRAAKLVAESSAR